MIFETINLKVDYKKAGIAYEGLCPTLTAYAPDKSEEFKPPFRPAVLILPGGGYDYCSDREGDPVALKLAGNGISAFVLKYSCVKKRYPTALLEALAAMKYIRDNAERYSVLTDKISVMGFSAGGHLAGCVSNFYFEPELLSVIGANEDEVKPHKTLLCYPVITSGRYAHEGSIVNLLDGAKDAAALRAKLSLENSVSEKTTETFLWHVADDSCVPVENSLLYMTALSKHKIPFEAHIFEWGGHGMSLCDKTIQPDEASTWHDSPTNAKWVEAAIRFIKN